MGPPRKGTREYKAYLEKQRDRRRIKRRTAAGAKALNNNTVKEALATCKRKEKELCQELELVKKRSNNHFRKAGQAEKWKEEARLNLLAWKNLQAEHKKELEAAKSAKSKKVEGLKSQVAQLQKELVSEKARADAAETRAKEWDNYWDRVSSKARAGTLRWLKSEVVPRPAPDRCWGGGQ
jgi:hypothetical protein